jgi:pyrrolidone-carboxylate peptidase
MSARILSLLAVAALALGACVAPTDDVDSSEDDVKVLTNTPLAVKQYKVNLAFAKTYKPRCKAKASALSSRRPRVLVTGFGRFLSNVHNATGEMVTRLVPNMKYPLTAKPEEGWVDPPGPQTVVKLATTSWPKSGEVDVCAMVLPVFWDLAAALVLAEIDAFSPDLVVMNGVAGSRQPLWLEMGAINHADANEDGSGNLYAVDGPVVSTAAKSEYGRANLLSWQPVKEAMVAAIEEHGDVIAAADADGVVNETRFDEILPGVAFAGYPRTSNTYLCNNTTYTVGYVMDHPQKTVRLMEPSESKYGSGLAVMHKLNRSFVPRVFVHWPSELVHSAAQLDAGAAVLAAGIDAQLSALKNKDAAAPTRGDNAIADFK